MIPYYPLFSEPKFPLRFLPFVGLDDFALRKGHTYGTLTYEQRLKQSKPVLDAFLSWLKIQEQKVLPKSGIGKAVTYCLNQWDKLVAFLEDGRLEIDNNRSERSIKSVVIGRKAWLFSNTPQGARASAVIYSMVETAIANGLNPYYYLRYLFEQLPNMNLTDIDALDKVLPWSTTLPVSCISFKKLSK